MKHIAVVGSGVIGLCLAWELQKRGHEITLVDEHATVSGASMINAGWIVPSMSGPVPAPGVVTQSLKWLPKRDAPFSMSVHPNVEYARWLIAFMRAATSEQFARGFEIMSRLNEETFARFDTLIADGIAMEQHTNGLLYAFTSEHTLQHELDIFERFQPAAYRRIVPLRGEEMQEAEPALTSRNVAGFFLPQERSVRPETLVSGLVGALDGTSSVTRLVGQPVTSLIRSGKHVTSIQVGNRRIDADAVVVASGVTIRPLLRTVGVRVPIESGKGYSLTWTSATPRLRSPVYLHDERVAITPFAGAIRAAGTMHLGQSHMKLNQANVAAIAKSARASFSGWPEGNIGLSVTAGLRPLTPDGLPVIGRAGGFDNLFVAGGHAMLGVTLGPVTAFELANLIDSGHASERITKLTPDRFA